MADQIEINIYMRDGGSGEQTAVADATGAGANVPGVSNSGNTSGGNTKNSTANLGAIGKYVASQTIDVFLANTKSVISQNIGLVTGKSELQQRVNIGMNIIQQGVNTYKNVQAGRILFTSRGMSGGAGAVLGAALSVISYGINLAFEQGQLNIKQNLENYQIAQTRTRAGAGFNRSREGN